MPHSVSPEPTPDSAHTEAMETGEIVAGQDPSQDSEDRDMTMVEADADIEGDEQVAVKSEVKLEELFADVESDEEFPSSTVHDNTKVSSSPEAPASPL